MSKIASHEEILEILSEQAREGSVTAAAALERALRNVREEDPEDPVNDAIQRILAEKKDSDSTPS